MGGIAGWSDTHDYWENDANWQGGTPDSGDVVIVNSLNRYPSIIGPGYQEPGGIIVVKDPAVAYSLHIGGASSGHLRIDHYGRLEVGNGGIALGTGSSGTQGSITLFEHSSLSVGGNYFVVGSKSQGRLLLYGGSEVEVAAPADFSLGASAAGDGRVRVSDATLTVKSRTYVGGEGTGYLYVHNGSTATFYKDVYVGTASGSHGELLLGYAPDYPLTQTPISGGNVNAYANLEIGVFGQGNAQVERGSTVNVSLDTIIGSELSGVGSLVLSGSGTTWHTGGNLTVGLLGNGTLTVSDGAQISSRSFSNIALQGGSGGSSVTVTGTGSQWIVGSDSLISANLGIGGQAEGTLTVSDGGQVKVTGAVDLGDISGTGTVTVTDASSLLKSGAYFQVGKNGLGEMTVSDGAEVITETFGTIAAFNGSGGSSATILGVDSRWSIGTDLVVSNAAKGLLSIRDGGRVEAGGSLSIGDTASGDGTVGVVGTGSQLSATDGIQVGNLGIGTVLIFSGGHMETGGMSVIGVESGSNGHVGMSDSGSSFISTGGLRIGAGGTGKLAIGNGAFVSAASVDLGTNEGASGTIELSGSSGNRAMIATGHLSRGSGSGTVLFDGGILRATGNHSDFIAHFEEGDTRILSGGAFLDTQEFTVGISAVFQGEGGLNKLGKGKLTLSGVSTYEGLTAIEDGALKLDATGSIDNTSGVSLGTDGTFDVSDKTGGYTVRRLSGSGRVTGALTVSTELAIGNSPGTVDFDDLVLNSSTTLTYELMGGGADADLGNIGGTLDLGDATLDLVQLGAYTAGDKFTLFAYTGDSLIGTFAGLADGDIFDDAGGSWQIRYFDTLAGVNGGVGDSFVTVMAVPEPRVALLCCFGSLFFLCRRRVRFPGNKRQPCKS